MFYRLFSVACRYSVPPSMLLRPGHMKFSCDPKGFDVSGELPSMNSGQPPGDVQDGPQISGGLRHYQKNSSGCGWMLSHIGHEDAMVEVTWDVKLLFWDLRLGDISHPSQTYISPPHSDIHTLSLLPPCMSGVLLLPSLPLLVGFRKSITFCLRNGRKLVVNFHGFCLSDNSPSALAARGNFQKSKWIV